MILFRGIRIARNYYFGEPIVFEQGDDLEQASVKLGDLLHEAENKVWVRVYIL